MRIENCEFKEFKEFNEVKEFNKVKEFKEAQKPGDPHVTEWCCECGEKITDNYHRIRDDKAICRSCAGESYYEVID